MSRYVQDVNEFLKNLDRWIGMQESVLESFTKNYSRVRESDRLDIIVHTRIAFNHIIRTLKAFDDWLQDPFITTNAPKESLVKVWDQTVNILQEILKMDIGHTSQMRDTLEKLSKEGKLNPIIIRFREGPESRNEGRGTTITF
ncbi:MAG: DUF2153 domain-containing protein [Caldisphaeraceae archaeon]|nr:DUF2153 domain-containing protein [Caldisphaeraceae archaeon]MCE4623208.1 DUF2153 domain-containing protein [Caldisphaeraceae archaeon]MEB2793666.1 DUF2153 domain-containing protein [Caldisphaeraceae archaeon]MEB3692325.1 DUF2153 domain-containing protein [Caldisphaeraceae archaeon]MEB3798252.1 DUF2153 domain-containing protein [Caldisphaeraceae archaeon]